MIEQLNNMPKLNILQAASQTKPTGAVELSHQFNNMLTDAITELNTQQAQVERLNGQFIRGELNDVHQLTISAEKAELGLQLTVQMRNKVIEAYQEIMRMQL
ncbi:flagellar hook-basal body complex protein FliE [Paenibacillus sp. J31TS4]|uniref:flagellar hook-basal body complex protein FliE n=1 Tax=Paenibacillus sp. J31TS4 TaxID=2807195 RepID=UPI001B2C7F25|nr:flagellar hook-basal body complex protein FliE [Paenibacillus sp. J31TS4]GIP36807.1 flagellar hook-basal body complex protein FliE [Paenibacillus sp. J31TS4]